MTTRTPALLPAALVLAAAGLLVAGPLNPPAGPVAPSFKTLTETEPRTAVNAANTPGDSACIYKITQPGSYYLTGNVAGAAGKSGIEITAHGVTLDLAGFCVDGTFGGLIPTVDGVRVGMFKRSIVIRNGTVRNWGQDGIDLASSPSAAVESILTDGNGRHGIVVGAASTITRCASSDNGADGIRFASGGGTARECTSSSNTGHGFTFTGAGSRITGCTAHANTGHGILADAAAIIQDNICTSNGYAGATGTGIQVTGSGSRIESNTVQFNDTGLKTTAIGNLIVRNIATSNSVDYDPFVLGFSYPGFGGLDSIDSGNWYSDPWTNFDRH